jgi:aminoglycoside 3-N-acetyltransferase
LISEWLRDAGEIAAKQVYWRCAPLRQWLKRRRRRRKQAPQSCDRRELRDYLRGIGVQDGALVMAHTSVGGLALHEPEADGEAPSGAIATANRLVDDLVELVAAAGTLVMPAHAIYQATEEFIRNDGRQSPLRYDPARTPCCVGLANELFWRRPGVERSLHPFNSLAACGPLAAELFRDNLNDAKPLPHGVYSGYYRFCRKNGLVVSIGTPLSGCLTLAHVPEDVLDGDWPIEDFFQECRYLVRTGSVEQPWIVRQVRAEYSMFCRRSRKTGRDLRREGILREGLVGSVRVDWAHAGEVFDYIMGRCRSEPYPYRATWLVRRRR